WTYTELYALSGFLALSFEIVWFRLLGVMLKSTSMTFGTLLTIYLLGLGVGAGMGSAVATRVRRARLAFVCLQVGAAAYAVLSLTVVIARSQGWRPIAWLPVVYSGADSVNVGSAVLDMRAAIAGWFAAGGGHGQWPWAL